MIIRIRNDTRGVSVIVTLAVRALTRGGAQTQCVALAKGLAARGHAVEVAVFYAGGAMEPMLAESGTTVVSLGKCGRWDLLSPTRALARRLKETGAQVLCTYLPMENILGLAAARWAGVPIVCGLRAALVDTAQFGIGSRLLYAAQHMLITRADAIMSNSFASLRELRLTQSERHHVVSNGIDTHRFAPDRRLREAFRRQVGIADQHKLVGLVARLDPIKDHSTFLAAVRIVADRNHEARFVIVGDGQRCYRAQLVEAAAQLGLSDRISWVSETDNLPAAYNGLDVLVLSSRGEGLPNVLLEGLACGVPVVSTNVGDVSIAVGDFGRLVAVASPAELAEAILVTLRDGGVGTAERRHRWICENFGLDAMISRTEAILSCVVGGQDG